MTRASTRTAHTTPTRRWGGNLFLLASLAAAGLGVAGCAGGRFVRPTGAAVPFPEAGATWAEMTQGCRDVARVRAELRVSGRIRGQRVPGLTTGLAVDASRLAIDARAGARRVFHLAGDSAEVVLLQYLDGRAARGPAADLVDALVGVRLGPARLLALLTGCVTSDPAVVESHRIGSMARIRTADTLVYLDRDDGRWRLVGAEFDNVVADYRRMDGAWPGEVELRREPDVTLTLRVVEFEHNPPLSPALFSLSVPGSFVVISLDELRQGGALGQRDR